jgi:hypothetical protein
MPYGTVNADLMTTSDGVSSSGLYGFKNRIINGAMNISQGASGASVTPTVAGSYATNYAVDRFNTFATVASKYTIQQTPSATETGFATRVGAGFRNYLAVTSSSAYSVGSTDYFLIAQAIEGFNTADLAFGTSNAKTITLSFWAYSSLTGTFGGSLSNSALSRAYPFSYTISSANTWTQISVTIAGDTSGTWVGSTNGTGLTVFFNLGSGTSQSTTANAWATGFYTAPTGATSVVGTNGATFYITGVQLEKGSTATSFDYRPYGTEFQMCQRYYQVFGGGLIGVTGTPTTAMYSNYPFPVTMRAAPTTSASAVFAFDTPGLATYTQSSASLGTNVVTTSGAFFQLDNFTGLIATRSYNQSNSSLVRLSAEL